MTLPPFRQELVDLKLGHRHVDQIEAETFWPDFLPGLAKRGLRGIKLMISDAHQGIKAAVSKVMHATWQPCRVHFMRNVSAHAGRSERRVANYLHERRLSP